MKILTQQPYSGHKLYLIIDPNKCTAKLKSKLDMGLPIQDEKVALKEQTENTNHPSPNLDKNKLQEEGRVLQKRM